MRLIIVSVLASVGICQRNNVCKDIEDYYSTDTNPNCWFNPDVEKRSADIITGHGYPVEQYQAVTKDYFILTVFRIPPRNKHVKGIVYLQHPALTSSSVWLSQGNNSFAFLLSDAGYDVWMGNFRTTSYSESHKYLSKHTHPTEYWNFTFHELGIYDLPAQIELVRQKTGYKEKLIYIGQSIGTAAALVYSSLKPEEAEENIKIFILWSPVAFLGNSKSPLRFTAPYIKTIANVLNVQGISYSGGIHKSVENVHLLNPAFLQMLSMFVEYVAGPQYNSGNPPALPVMLYQSFEGLSIKTCRHFGQLVISRDRFQMFDYGISLNKVYYNTIHPPSYPLKEIRTPVRLTLGINDYLTVEEDIHMLYNTLSENIKVGLDVIENFNHFDFFYSKDVAKLLYIPTIKYLKELVER